MRVRGGRKKVETRQKRRSDMCCTNAVQRNKIQHTKIQHTKKGSTVPHARKYIP